MNRQNAIYLRHLLGEENYTPSRTHAHHTAQNQGSVLFTVLCAPYDPIIPLLYNRKQLTASELL